MAKFDPKKLARSQQEKIWDEFCQVVASLDNFEEVKRFFRDLLNRTERTMLARRLQIAKLLKDGFTYEEIRKLLRVGMTTISKVERWLNFGRGGYKGAITKLDKIEEKIRKEKIPLTAYESLKKKYALYYWPEKVIPKVLEEIKEIARKSGRKKSVLKILRS